jgi:hypothetical protein
MTLRDWDISHRNQAFLLGTLGFEVSKQDREELIDPLESHAQICRRLRASFVDRRPPARIPYNPYSFFAASKHKHG